ncbi:hypothetical protein V1477_014070 [Vespula maculifrons]|uniref:Uncharacterized protein n=1 Tax=Vespula maculifrons TaxID=7453 RepID=A0ABD2BLK0_VESMC
MKARSLRRNAREVATKILIPGVELCLARYIGHLSISLDSLIEPSLNLSFFRRTTGQVGARGWIPVEEETEEEEEEAEDEEEEEEEEAEYEEEGLKERRRKKEKEREIEEREKKKKKNQDQKETRERKRNLWWWEEIERG